MKSKIQNFKQLSLVSVVISLVYMGCASVPPGAEPLPSTADPNTEIQMNEESINQARVEQVDILAPENFKRAVNAHESSVKYRNDGEESEEILQQVAYSRAWLKIANDKAVLARSSLRLLPAARRDALRASTTDEAKEEIKDIDDDLRDLTEEIEEGDLSSINKEEPKLHERYRKHEVKSVIAEYLNPAKENVAQAKKEDAKKFAPQSLMRTEYKIAAAEKEIEKDPQDIENIGAMSSYLVRDSNRLLEITRNAKLSRENTPEETVIQMMNQQAEVESLARNQDELRTQKAHAEARVVNLIQKQREMNKAENISSLFDPGEADVLQEGKNIIIRVKGLTFKPSQANIQPEHYLLLNKVKDALSQFQDTNVIVEGHTDSVGSANKNKTLSEKRANAVKEYLVANNAVSVEHVSVVGKGFEKPVAANNTAEGRANNRRIDIIIQNE